MTQRRGFILFILVTLTLLSSCTLERPATEQVPPQPPQVSPTATQTPAPAAALEMGGPALVAPTGEAFVPGEVLVKFKAEIIPELPSEKEENLQGLSIGSPQLDPTFQNLGITSLEPVLAPVASALGVDTKSFSAQAGDTGQLYVAQFDASKDVNSIASALADNDQVEYAEPNFVAFATAGPGFAPLHFTPNDPFFSFQWNLQAIQMPRAWDFSTGANVTVAVLDTGAAFENFEIYRQAPDLAGTQFVPGYDFVNHDRHPNDDHGHGTHVTGTVAQTTNNGQGVAGVAFNARLMVVKVLDARGQGSYDVIIQGIYFAVNSGAKVINLSLSGQSNSRSLEEAINFARARGVLTVAATGNNNGVIGYPAFYNNTIAVGAVRFDQSRARYSNFGPQIDLVAPGGDNNVDQNGDGFGDGIVQQTFKIGELNTFRYLFFEGTSMATPHVSGLIALLLSRSPNLSPDQIETLLETTAKDLGPPGFDEQYGYGLVQAADALDALINPLPTATPTPTSTPGTPTPPTPSPEGNILLNSSFETDEGWIFKPTVKPGGYTSALAHSGSRSALIGITDANADRYSFSSVAQKVTIPADAQKVTLTAFVYPVSQDTSSRDLQITSVLNQRFREVERLSNQLSNAQTWQQQTFDLTKYKGRTIYVYFGVVNRTTNGTVTALYVDDVTLVVSK